MSTRSQRPPAMRYRPARRTDVETLAELGLLAYRVSSFEKRREFYTDHPRFSLRDVRVGELEGRIVASLVLYPLDAWVRGQRGAAHRRGLGRGLARAPPPRRGRDAHALGAARVAPARQRLLRPVRLPRLVLSQARLRGHRGRAATRRLAREPARLRRDAPRAPPAAPRPARRRGALRARRRAGPLRAGAHARVVGAAAVGLPRRLGRLRGPAPRTDRGLPALRGGHDARPVPPRPDADRVRRRESRGASRTGGLPRLARRPGPGDPPRRARATTSGSPRSRPRRTCVPAPRSACCSTPAAWRTARCCA